MFLGLLAYFIIYYEFDFVVLSIWMLLTRFICLLLVLVVFRWRLMWSSSDLGFYYECVVCGTCCVSCLMLLLVFKFDCLRLLLVVT